MPSLRQAIHNILKSRRFLDQFSAEEQERIKQKYRDSIGLTQDVAKDMGAGAFKAHADKRIQDSSGFTTQVGPEKEDTFAKLIQGDDPVDKKEVRTRLEELLKPQKFYTDAQETYKDSMEFFKKRINQIPELSVEQIRGYLEQINQRGRKAIEAQQKKELEDFKAELNKPEFSQKIEIALGKTPEEVEKIKKDLIAGMEKSHSDQLTAFNDSAKANMTVLDKASALENKRLLFTGQLESWKEQLSSSQRDEMEHEMALAREENLKRRGMEAPARNTTAYVDFEKNTVSAINPEDLNFIISLSGNKLKHKKAQDGKPGLWTATMPARILSPFYYLSNKELPKVDMLTMAQAVRASGFDSITMTINFEDEKTRTQRARQAYEAALEAGFPPGPLPGEEEKEEKEQVRGIHLKDGSGKEIKPEEIFSASELTLLHERAAKKREKLDKLVKDAPRQEPSEELTKQYRKEIDDGRVLARMTGKAKDEIEAEQEKVRRQESDNEQVVKGITG
ncbi:hypothetical protein [Legionella parisiensis]|uniref:Coiled coil domain-containing protein n=1 Tax=Legionella parisiensis TaxID=45071 RepID=A0A1E5JN14_9GAMM|nr:hypothetical protein [Legionella parisiensis]KTD41716.1 coiled coil domain-containing protein [Legionella parisiensis]OEH45733.1 hypothetical protein lpari_03246 [Legionella parisiensis]STX75962.1 coiled coil domain protein [Legionella parisiensis]